MKAANHSSVPAANGRGFFNFRSWTIGRRVVVGFVLVILAAAGLGIFAVAEVKHLGGLFSSVADDNVPSLELIARVELASTVNRLIVFKHISTSSEDDMNQLEAQFAENGKIIDAALTDYGSRAVTTEDHATIDAVTAARVEYVKKAREVFQKSRTTKNNEEVYHFARNELDPLGKTYAAALGKATEHEKQCVLDAETEFKDGVNATLRGAGIGLAIAVIIGITVAFAIIRSTGSVLRAVSSSLSNGADQVASSAHQVSAASQALAEGSSEQAASLEETGSSLEEMSSMTRRNSENSDKANDLTKQARHAADVGATDMKAMKEAMEQIKVSGDDIAKIIKTIDEIAFQTNILALNAAVEAARAGTAGAGFAVVADEVRALAQRSANAAKETADKIEGSLSKTAQGVSISEKVYASLSEIVEKVRQVDQLVAEVSTASREQSQGVGQINSAVSQMDKVVQSAASNAEETAAAAEELNGQAQLMRESVDELLALVGQTSHHKENPSRPVARSSSAREGTSAKNQLSLAG